MPLRSILPAPKPRLVLGRKRGLRRRPISVTEAELLRHALILGTTGSGKTTAAMTLLTRAAELGWAVVLIDLKGDQEIAAQLEHTATQVRASYRQFSIAPGERRDSWQPLRLGDPAAQMSKTICLSEWTEPYYRSVCERYAQVCFACLHATGQPASFERLIALLDQPQALRSLARLLHKEHADQVKAYIDSVVKDRGQLSALAGLAARIGTLCDAGGPLHQLHERLPELDLSEISQHGGVACFSLSSAHSPVTSAQIATLALLDLQSLIAQRLAQPERCMPMLVCVDEFSAVGADHIAALFARARASRVAVMLATQELADLTRIDSGFRDQVLGLTGTKLVLRQEVADSADVLARTIGTRTGSKSTRQVRRGALGAAMTGQGSEREVEEFVVHPNVFKRLRVGEAVLLRKDPWRCERLRITRPAA